ncbi:MAG TPA: hypothetical protein PKH58_13960, partial [Paludibacteraceae bacterium]|nr:hypothetical protein [Paludibacteraceae bacterium]
MRRFIFFLLSIAVPLLVLADKYPEKTNDGNSPPPCHTVLLSKANVSCFGGSNGTVTATISKAGTYRVIWSNGVTINSTTSLTHQITSLSAGYYDVQVIDLVSGCAAFDIIEVTQPALLTTSKTSVDVKCFGQST